MKTKKIFLWSISIIILLVTIVFVIQKNIKQKEIRIGVPLVNNEDYQYDILKENLESKFHMKVTFVDLYKDLYEDETEQDLMRDIDAILKNNQIDMLLGIPSHQLQYAIENDRFLDITHKIEHLENLHKGIVTISEKRGDGKLYYMSPVIDQISFLFQNKALLDELDIKPLSEYASWNQLLSKLDEVQEKINETDSEKFPLALSVKNIDEDILYSAYDYQTQAFGLDSSSMENDTLSDRWKEFYKIFAEIIAKYGMSLKDMENGIYPKNYIFTNNKYAFLLADSYDLELLFNQSMNEDYNKNALIPLEVDFPVTVSYLNYDGSKLQNLRDSSIAIDKDTKKATKCTKILNYLLSKEYALEMISNMGKYSHFSNSTVNYPTYFDEDTIAKLNEVYAGKFDAHLIYDVEQGSVIYNTDLINDSNRFNDIFNQAFTMVFESRDHRISRTKATEQSLEYIEERMKSDIHKKTTVDAQDTDGSPKSVNEDSGLTTKQFSIPKFSEGVYIKGGSFHMDSKGSAILTSTNQMALDNSQKADISYQVIDNESGEVYSEVRKIGNLAGLTIDLSSEAQKDKEVKIYVHNNSGVETHVSGEFNW